MSTTPFHYKYIFVLLLMPLGLTAFSQRLTIWKGGTPGKPNDWFCAKNWSTGHVPDEFSDVIIPDVSATSFATPVIRSGAVDVHSLHVMNNATMHLGKDVVIYVSGEIIQSTSGTIAGEGRVLSETMQLDAKDFAEVNAKNPSRNDSPHGQGQKF